MSSDETPTVASVYGAHVAPPPAAPAARRSTSPLAALLAVLAVAGWWFGLMVSAHIIPVLDFRLGRVGAALAAGGGVLAALVNTPATKRIPKIASAAAAMVGGLVFLALVSPIVPPGYWALRSELRSLNPPGWKLLDESTAGNSICFDVCTSVERKLQANTDEVTAESVLVRMLRSHGYQQTERSYEGGRIFRKDHFRVSTYYSAGQPAGSIYGEIAPGWFISVEAA